MGNYTERLAAFVAGARITDLPSVIVHETKRSLLDTIGCAINGLTMDGGRIAAEFARRLSGPGEATIIGTRDKVASCSAAFANAQLSNAMDFDGGSVYHDTPAVFGGTLALAEASGSTGRDLLLAVAIAHELATRLQLASKSSVSVAWDRPDGAKASRPGMQGFDFVTLAVAAAGGKLLGIKEDQIRNAVGIASFIHPPNPIERYFDTSPVKMVKYTVFGQIAEAGVRAALLAQMGFTADAEALDGETSLWKRGTWEPHKITEGLGDEWIHKIGYKLYPSNLGTAGAKDCLISIVTENNIQPEDIDKVTARISPVWQHRAMRENTLKTQEDFLFNVAYQLSCAAHRVSPARWLDAEVRNDPKLRTFMQRVQFDIGCDEKEYSEVRLKNPGAELMSAEVIVRGRAYRKQTHHHRGADSPVEYRLTDEELIAKFRDNVSLALSRDATSKAVDAVFNLEKIGRIEAFAQLFAS